MNVHDVVEPKRILIVDNSRPVHDLLSRILSELNPDLQMTFTAAFNGLQALYAGKETRFDLILLEMDLPTMDGAKFLQKRRKIAKLKEVPVVVVSRVSTPETVTQALQLGATAYLRKPIMIEKLKTAVMGALGWQAEPNAEVPASDPPVHHPAGEPTPEQSEKGHLEVYLNGNIVVAEVHGALDSVTRLALHYRLSELAIYLPVATKRFLIILASTRNLDLTPENIRSLFLFREAPGAGAEIPLDSIKVITNSEHVVDLLAKDPVLKEIEVVDGYVNGLRILNLLLLRHRTSSIRIDFIRPGTSLNATVFDRDGNLVKHREEEFLADELAELAERGIDRLFYVEMSPEDEQVFDSPYMDLTGVKLPEQQGFLIRG